LEKIKLSAPFIFEAKATLKMDLLPDVTSRLEKGCGKNRLAANGKT